MTIEHDWSQPLEGEEIELDTDYPEPEHWERCYEYKHKLWKLRFGYQEDKNLSFEENVKDYIKFNIMRSRLNKIINIATMHYFETGEEL